jgi:hypothetical protein
LRLSDLQPDAPLALRFQGEPKVRFNFKQVITPGRNGRDTFALNRSIGEQDLLEMDMQFWLEQAEVEMRELA